MRRFHSRLTVLVGLSVISLATTARAQEAAAAKPAPKKFESSAGVKLLVGGNVWTTPSEVPGGDGLAFRGNGGGFGWGGAAYYEARFVQHLGLELDVGYDKSTVLRNVTINGVVDVQEKFTHSGLRWGFLAKGIIPAPFGRMWLGLGPEFMSSSSVDASIDNKLVLNKISAKSKSSTMFTFAFGMAIHIGENLEIPVDVRAAKNLSQENKWADRVKLQPNGDYEVTAQNSWDFRLATGLGYRF